MPRQRRAVSDLTRLFPDQPVRTGPVAFEFEGIAQTLAELALNPANETPFTVVVKGEWGRGKTTLLRTTQRLLDEDGAKDVAREHGYRQVRTLWLNTWKYPQEDMILAGLLGALLDRLRSGPLTEQLKLFAERHKDVGPLLKALGSWVPGLGDIVGAVEADRYRAVEEKRAFYDHFRELFGQLSRCWFLGDAWRDTFGRTLEDTSEQYAVAIFLDDLDRCPEKRVLETFEAITLFADLPGVCFYLGVDWERVSEVLGRLTGGRQAHFLEKIVQVEVDLPEVAEEGAEEYLRALVSDTSLAPVLEGEVETVARTLQRRNPRHAKRFLNDLSIRLGLLANTGKLGDGDDQVTEADVLSWHLLREAAPAEKWAYLTRHRGHLIGFLNVYESSREALGEGQDATRPESVAEDDFALFQRSSLRPHLDRLVRLDGPRRDVLVHLGSPPVAVVRPVAPPTRSDPGDPGSWVQIPGGTFQMGSSDVDRAQPVHTVRLGPFEISRYPVTNAEYARYVSEQQASPPRHWTDATIPDGLERHPVVNVSWDAAGDYCTWLATKREGTVTLPTEAQWEYAAAGAQGRRYPWADDDDEPTDKHANFGDTVGTTTPVGSYPKGATPEGVHDLAGNVWEWCSDWYGSYEAGDQTDPAGPETGNRRVLRGGAFSNDPDALRCAYRGYGRPVYAGLGIGFRCVVVASGGQNE